MSGTAAETARAGFRRILTDVEAFSVTIAPDRRLRSYQVRPAQTIVDMVMQPDGAAGPDGIGQMVAVFSRQSGKDEMLAQVLAMLLVRHAQRGGNIVVAAPTFRPQAALSRDRLRDRLLGSPLTAPLTRVHDGYAISVGRATARFLSAGPQANARGQTADLLLVANEAQDIDPDVWDAVFDPMAASTNAPTLFMGTVWSASTLLARQTRFLRERSRTDGRERVFFVPWEEVAQEVPAYGERVRSRIAQLGADHPFVKTEYCLRELDGEGSLFPPSRLAQLEGDHPRQQRAMPGGHNHYALLLDVAGEEEGGGSQGAFSAGEMRRDSTALTVVEVTSDGSCRDRPVYRVVDRRMWTGVRHTALHDQLVDLARNVWQARWVVVDATGIGAGLASFLRDSLTRRAGHGGRIEVVPFVFTRASKSQLGWDFLGLIDTGRFKEYAGDGDELTRLYRRQLAATTYEIGQGPGAVLRWGVPERDGHDDLVLSAALCAVLDRLDHRPRIAMGG
ncbi:MAG: hypothetical protein QM589_10280 [Thermomicrobiales bacterium]